MNQDTSKEYQALCLKAKERGLLLVGLQGSGAFVVVEINYDGTLDLEQSRRNIHRGQALWLPSTTQLLGMLPRGKYELLGYEGFWLVRKYNRPGFGSAKVGIVARYEAPTPEQALMKALLGES